MQHSLQVSLQHSRQESYSKNLPPSFSKSLQNSLLNKLLNSLRSCLATYTVIFAVALLAGCSGGDSNPPSLEPSSSGQTTNDEFTEGDSNNNTDQSDTRSQVIQVGYFNVENTVGGPVFYQPDFFLLDDDVLVQLDNGLAEDTCEIDGSDNSDIDLQVVFDSGVAISAGESLVLNSPAGTFATIDRVATGNSFFYPVFDQASEPPSGLTLSIPGDEFPPFENIVIPVVSVLENVMFPADENLSATSSFTWTASINSGSEIELGITIRDAQSNLTSNIDCRILDDGDFQLPAQITAAFDNFDNASVNTFKRIETNSVLQDTSLLLVSRSIAVPLPLAP